jgi:hypothetical protein
MSTSESDPCVNSLSTLSCELCGTRGDEDEDVAWRCTFTLTPLSFRFLDDDVGVGLGVEVGGVSDGGETSRSRSSPPAALSPTPLLIALPRAPKLKPNPPVKARTALATWELKLGVGGRDSNCLEGEFSSSEDES